MIGAVVSFALLVAVLLVSRLPFIRRRRRTPQPDGATGSRGLGAAKTAFLGVTLLWLLIAWLLIESGHDTAGLAALVASTPSFAATTYFARLGRRAAHE